jgi:hypothetical protein
MIPNKINEDANRLRFVRVLERFKKNIVGYLFANPEASKEQYAKKIDINLKNLQKTPEAKLYKGDLQDLHNLVKKMINAKESDDEMKQIREDLLYASNQLEKNKNARKYKKDKHAKSS